MDEMPELPDYFTEPARNAFFRIYRFLEYHGLWDELCYSVVEMTSMTCYSYLKIAKANKLPACEIEEMRIVARRSLADCLYIPQNRIHLAAINSDGLDVDIVAVCAPLPVDYLPAA